MSTVDDLDRSLRVMLGFTAAEDQEAAARGECVWFIGGHGQRVCGTRYCREHNPKNAPDDAGERTG